MEPVDHTIRWLLQTYPFTISVVSFALACCTFYTMCNAIYRLSPEYKKRRALIKAERKQLEPHLQTLASPSSIRERLDALGIKRLLLSEHKDTPDTTDDVVREFKRFNRRAIKTWIDKHKMRFFYQVKWLSGEAMESAIARSGWNTYACSPDVDYTLHLGRYTIDVWPKKA